MTKIKFLWDTVVTAIKGDQKVSSIIINNVKTGDEGELKCDGVFVAIGYIPNTDLLKDQLGLDEKGYIVTKDETRTTIPGVFVAGDVGDYRYRQAIMAAGAGCKVALDAKCYLEELKV